jgi:hypothetical protein
MAYQIIRTYLCIYVNKYYLNLFEFYIMKAVYIFIFQAVLRIRIRIHQIHMFLGLSDPESVKKFVFFWHLDGQ